MSQAASLVSLPVKVVAFEALKYERRDTVAYLC